MKTLELEVKHVNQYASDDYILNDFELSEESLEELAKLLGLEENEDFDDVKDEAAQWFLDNYEEENSKVEATEFYNRTISHKDISVSYEADLVAEYNDTKIVAHVDFEQDCLYNNAEAKQVLAEQPKKLYLSGIEHVEYIEDFEEIQNDFEEDYYDDWFTYDKGNFEWWEELANALYELECEGVDIKAMEVNELQDYIDAYNEL